MLEEALRGCPLRDAMRTLPRFPYPTWERRAAWEALDPADRADLTALADAMRDAPYPMLTATQFMAFTREGSRQAWETPYFFRRKKLIAAAMGCCVSGTLDDLDNVIDGLWCVCEETSWIISAHNDGASLPEGERPIVDLFSAQTAMILALTIRLLGGPLDHAAPRVTPRVRREIERRVLTPFLTRDDFWWMGFTRRDLCNWTPWIVSNVMMAACAVMTDREALAGLLTRGCGMLDRWLACVPEDGGCDEGTGYWNMAGGSLLDCLTLLETSTEGRFALWKNEKLRRVLAFPAKVWLGGQRFVNFADCDALPLLNGERLQTAGEKIGDAALVRLGCAMRGKPSDALRDVPHFSRLLDRLFHPAGEISSAEEKPRDEWLPDSQLRVIERGGLLLCAKGGHNGESHNHNDVGSFILQIDGEPAIVDAGNMTYTAQTFSADRYALWNTRAAYHNVPMVGGAEQREGAEHAAREVVCLPDGLRLDLAAAYPAEAGVQRCLRTLIVAEDALRLTDEIVLTEEKSVTWVFLLRHRPELTRNGVLSGPARLTWVGELRAEIEEIPVTDGRMARCWPGSLWRMTLTDEPARAHCGAFRVERGQGSAGAGKKEERA